MTTPPETAPEEALDLPVVPPVAPMLAKAVKAMPRQDGSLYYEPKWDGFRCIVFRDGDEVYLGSRNERPFTRYFPELVEAVKAELPPKCVVDGEIVLIRGQSLDFDALQQRIHPAASRVRMLAETTPASFVAFDLLAIGDEDLMEAPFSARRARLEEVMAGAGRSVRLTPITRDEGRAGEWFDMFEGAGLDGIVVKPGDLPYTPDKRVMFKVKHERTADCVVAGYREHKTGPIVGSLLLGLYSPDGRLHHVGVAASFPMKRREELVEELAPYRLENLGDHPWGHWAEVAGGGAQGQRLPGAVSRWNAKKDLSFIPLRPELVIEVAYDHMEGDRFRHTAQFRRWRPDREPSSCTYEQLERPVVYELDDILAK
ncbi:ATP-dependent DNA ligase [Microbispora corallina]|uniref:DNA ligase (ATP) n=1 Tax=Microbispora corallina TaxID=83302 RepID=A0ABQ4FU23_9ACTN|nr:MULTISPECIES: ATP-dependent DNA ligase [Microbispora]ETK32452.1 ATP-dependent DNA ligase [Microbispora sp. ATCC PTA-5024]GIH38304.1 putative DNA ligase LigC [Microbispora corallina]